MCVCAYVCVLIYIVIKHILSTINVYLKVCHTKIIQQNFDRNSA